MCIGCACIGELSSHVCVSGGQVETESQLMTLLDDLEAIGNDKTSYDSPQYVGAPKHTCV